MIQSEPEHVQTLGTMFSTPRLFLRRVTWLKQQDIVSRTELTSGFEPSVVDILSHLTILNPCLLWIYNTADRRIKWGRMLATNENSLFSWHNYSILSSRTSFLANHLIIQRYSTLLPGQLSSSLPLALSLESWLAPLPPSCHRPPRADWLLYPLLFPPC